MRLSCFDCNKVRIVKYVIVFSFQSPESFRKTIIKQIIKFFDWTEDGFQGGNILSLFTKTPSFGLGFYFCIIRHLFIIIMTSTGSVTYFIMVFLCITQ